MNALQQKYLTDYFQEFFRESDVSALTKSVEGHPAAFQAMVVKTKLPPIEKKEVTRNIRENRSLAVNTQASTSTQNDQINSLRFDLHGFTGSIAPLCIRRILMSIELSQSVRLKFVVGRGHHNDNIKKPVLRNIVLNLARVFCMKVTEGPTNKGELWIDLVKPEKLPDPPLDSKPHYGYCIVNTWTERGEAWKIPSLVNHVTGRKPQK